MRDAIQILKVGQIVLYLLIVVLNLRVGAEQIFQVSVTELEALPEIADHGLREVFHILEILNVVLELELVLDLALSGLVFILGQDQNVRLSVWLVHH